MNPVVRSRQKYFKNSLIIEGSFSRISLLYISKTFKYYLSVEPVRVSVKQL